MDPVEEVLEFWFGTTGEDGATDPAKRRMWFGEGRKYDAEIEARFGVLHAVASRGDLAREWTRTARGRLALIVVLDQLSRHIHRGTTAAFAQDPAAQELALEGISLRADGELKPAERAFFYLPFEHAENAELQTLSVRCFEQLARSVAEPHRPLYENFLDYARRHCEIIQRFGRFPHRNAVLGRTPTLEEIEFLKQPGSSF